MIFLSSVSSAAVLVFDLPLCTHTDTGGKQREMPESGIYFKIFEKNTIFNKQLLSYSVKLRKKSGTKGMDCPFNPPYPWYWWTLPLRTYSLESGKVFELPHVYHCCIEVHNHFAWIIAALLNLLIELQQNSILYIYGKKRILTCTLRIVFKGIIFSLYYVLYIINPLTYSMNKSSVGMYCTQTNRPTNRQNNL